VDVVVIGAGGVGGFLAALLGRAGHQVSVLARGKHLEAIQTGGLGLRSRQFGEIRVKAVASDDPGSLEPADVVILGVKMYDFAAAAQAAARLLKPNGLALTIQNGLDAPVDLSKAVGPDRVVIGTASIESTVLEPGVIGHLVPIHTLTIAEFNGPPTERLETLAKTLRTADINVSLATDGQQALWDKASSLIPIATMTAAASSGIGPIYQLPETRVLLQKLIQEAAAVARVCGYDVHSAQSGFMAMMEQAATVQPAFSTSMDRDFQAGKRTELEWLTGKLVRLAQEHKVEVPAHSVLYALLRLKEQRHVGAGARLVGASA
jgi:2-dehydropantoate 2-reductase